MSGHRYITDSKNLFLEDDVDDDLFLRNSRRPTSTSSSNYYSTNEDPMTRIENQRMSLLEKSRQIEQRTLESTKNSLGILRDSEQIGIATAEELQRQREKLESTDKRLDEINSTLRFSQKHLNGIKSVFGSLKNYLSGKNEQGPTNSVGGGTASSTGTTSMPDQPVSSNIGSTGQSIPTNDDLYNSHPLTRIRNTDNADVSRKTTSNDGNQFQAMINANLDEMLDSTIRLKGLAIDLSQEIDTQNDLIDNITYKTDKADLTIQRQNKDMNKILKK